MIFSSTNGLCLSLVFVVGISGYQSPALAQDWESIPVRLHSEYQATQFSSSSGTWVTSFLFSGARNCLEHSSKD
jgi:hypothetical protein